jgi:hypothetical protein
VDPDRSANAAEQEHDASDDEGRDWICSTHHFTKGISILKEDGPTAILAGVAAAEDIIV